MTTLIVDYGMGNLRSVQKAFEHIGEPAEICSSPTALARASRIVLPGVGAFRDAIAALHQHDLVNVLKDAIAADRPFLGICLGMQLLFSSSFEDGHHQGLDVIPGTVQRFQLPPEFKIPHMGWNQLSTAQSPPHPLFHGLPKDPWFYFVHSYHCVPTDHAWVAATTSYSTPFVSAVARSNVMAVQFHPEKSQSTGLQLLRNFVSCSQTPATDH
jgi:glutamine amidotransferase